MTVGDLGKLEYQLARFVRNQGLSPRRLELDGTELLALLGTTEAEELYERILSVLDEMEDDRYSDVLRNAFGVGYSKKPKLSERRAEWVERMKYPISENTMRRWEQRALKALARKLAASVVNEPLPQVTSTAKIDTPDEEVDSATLRQEIDDLKRQVAEQNKLLQEIMKRLPNG